MDEFMEPGANDSPAETAGEGRGHGSPAPQRSDGAVRKVPSDGRAGEQNATDDDERRDARRDGGPQGIPCRRCHARRGAGEFESEDGTGEGDAHKGRQRTRGTSVRHDALDLRSRTVLFIVTAAPLPGQGGPNETTSAYHGSLRTDAESEGTSDEGEKEEVGKGGQEAGKGGRPAAREVGNELGHDVRGLETGREQPHHQPPRGHGGRDVRSAPKGDAPGGQQGRDLLPHAPDGEVEDFSVRKAHGRRRGADRDGTAEDVLLTVVLLGCGGGRDCHRAGTCGTTTTAAAADAGAARARASDAPILGGQRLIEGLGGLGRERHRPESGGGEDQGGKAGLGGDHSAVVSRY
mmetsp:Transcript_11812/g.33696  ORF Transcript_11812/g.33696 Transcript_11812/m.33696 type:complete len:349 (-) Transcript_11812:154-1200(-)